MSTRNLDALFAPHALALIGASDEPGSVGDVLLRNLTSAGFGGAIFPVNPRHVELHGLRCYASVAELPSAPDLAVIATPPQHVADAVSALGQRGCRAAIVITAGGEALRSAVLNAAKPHLMRIVGPNCLGMLSTPPGINASFAHLSPIKGDIALLTQSGAIATSMLDWATGRGIGFSHIVSLGDMSDVDFGDLLDFLALDRETRSILLYVENITHARKFMSAARIAARAKPVLVVKAGRSLSGARAAASHTGALAGSDAVYDAAFRRAGMLRVDSLRDLFDAAETLHSRVRPRGNRLMIVTNGGGLGVLATDALEAGGGRLADLSAAGLSALSAVLPAAWSRGNPIDILGDAQPDRYRDALRVLSKEREADAILVVNCPTGVADSAANASSVTEARGQGGAPLVACWMGEATATQSRQILTKAGIPTYETPDEAVRAFLHLATYTHNQEILLETPHAPGPGGDAAVVRQILDSALSEGRSLLTEPEAKDILRAYGIPTVLTEIAPDAASAAAIANTLTGPVALKILSRDITHKSDVGGVRLNLRGGDEVLSAAAQMLGRVRAAAPGARIDGFTVQPMITRPHAQELILGKSDDATFGAVLLFGQGGVAVEVLADRAMALPPLNSVLAQDVIARTRVSKLLDGYRDRAPANVAAIVSALMALSRLTVDFPEIAELDINPLLADAEGVIALDARVVVRPHAGGATRHLAIEPYPSSLERDVTLSDGATVRLRPIRPDDTQNLIDMAQHTSAEDLRLRFHGVVRIADPQAVARLSQIDYDREMAIVAEDNATAIIGVGRLVFDPNFERAEYALIVRTDMQNKGLGRTLLAYILEHARLKGAHSVWGQILAENRNVIALARQMGAHIVSEATGTVRSEFRL